MIQRKIKAHRFLRHGETKEHLETYHSASMDKFYEDHHLPVADFSLMFALFIALIFL